MFPVSTVTGKYLFVWTSAHH